MKNKKAYNIWLGEHIDSEREAIIIFASNPNEAKIYCRENKLLEHISEYGIEIKILREEKFDKYYDGKKKHIPFDEDGLRIYRKEGWWFEEGSSQCATCGLYECHELSESHLFEVHDENHHDLMCRECIKKHNIDKECIEDWFEPLEGKEKWDAIVSNSYDSDSGGFTY